MDSRPNWSRDGQWIYFNSDRTGRFVYYGKGDQIDGIWRVPADGGEEAAVFASLKMPGWGWWDVTDEGIYFIPAEAAPPAQIQWSLKYFSFDAKTVSHVTDLPKPPAMCEALDVSSDGTWFLYAQWDRNDSDLMLVEDFR